MLLIRAAHTQEAIPFTPAVLATSIGPCDIYAAGGTPCVAAHSTTRSLYSRYRGPLYQVKRLSDDRTIDIGSVRTRGGGALADAAAQDRFCAHALCVINTIYDQSGRGNDLLQAAPGTFKGPGRGAFDTQPIADMAPITLSGQKVYGVYIMPGMGLRNNNASYLPIGDEPQGIYYVVDGTHYDSGCCFDYGNASTNGRAVGTGTMDTVYFGTSTVWGKGAGAGPWIMTDMEAGLFSGRDAKQNTTDPAIDRWRFVTAMVEGGGGNHWDLRGGDAQSGKLTTFYSGVRPDPNVSGGYFPMRRQGAVLLGTGGDNGNGSSGTFYEGVITAGHPKEATDIAVQANIRAARYDIARIFIEHIKSFTDGSSQDVKVRFTNPDEKAVHDLRIRLVLPSKWKAVSSNSGNRAPELATSVAEGASVTVTFKVTAPARYGSGYLTAVADWVSATGRGTTREVAEQRIRNVPPVKLNEVRFGTVEDPTNQFVELYNASNKVIDISGWRLVHTPAQWTPLTLATIPSSTRLAPHSFYLLGVSPSGLVSSAPSGAALLNVRSTIGLEVGQKIDIEGETRTIAKLGRGAGARTTLFIPVSTGPRLSVAAGATNVPVTSAVGFTVGEKIGLDAGDHYEVGTVSAVGKAATQTLLSASASTGADHIILRAGLDILPGDALTIGTGQRKEVAKVASVGGTADQWTIVLASPLKLDHMSGVDVSDRGSGISFTPATRFVHRSGDAVQPLGGGITLDRPLLRAHAYGAPLVASVPSIAGYEGPSVPDQWIGSVLSPAAGSIALIDAGGITVVDAIVYGSQQGNSSANGTITTPELATLEGDQGGGGCIVVVPTSLRNPGTSIQRSTDGADSDSNCTDFRSQSATSLGIGSPAGASNLKVFSVKGFEPGQRVLVGSGQSQETATISAVGTAGGSLLNAEAQSGTTVLSIEDSAGFLPTELVSIGTGAEAETAAILSVTRRGPIKITLVAPLLRSHARGDVVAGTGITFSDGLKVAHSAGESLASGVPTPGKASQ